MLIRFPSRDPWTHRPASPPHRRGGLGDRRASASGALTGVAAALVAFCPVPAQAYYIEWLTAMPVHTATAPIAGGAVGSATTIAPGVGVNAGANSVALFNSSSTSVVSGGAVDSTLDQWRQDLLRWTFRIHKSAPTETPVTRIEADIQALTHFSALPAARNGSDLGYVNVSVGVDGTGLQFGNSAYFTAGYGDGLAWQQSLYGGDTEYLAVETTYTLTFSATTYASTRWDGRSARYLTAEYDYADVFVKLLPEPPVVALVAVALLGMTLARRRRAAG